MRACVHACIHAYIHDTHKQTNKQTNKQTYIHTYIHRYIHTYMIRRYVHTYIYMFAYLYMSSVWVRKYVKRRKLDFGIFYLQRWVSISKVDLHQFVAFCCQYCLILPMFLLGGFHQANLWAIWTSFSGNFPQSQTREAFTVQFGSLLCGSRPSSSLAAGWPNASGDATST